MDAGSGGEEDGKPCAKKDPPPAAADAQGGGGDNTGGPSSKKVKPALKAQEHTDRREKKHLKWDEVAIEEHDQLRGTRMKIDEPNTPYTHYDSGAESDDSRRPKSPANQKPSLSWDTLQTRLDSVAAVQESLPDPSSDPEHSDVEEEHRKEMRKLEFKEHRKRHYNEMDLVKKFRREHPEGLLDDDDDEGGDADAEDN